MEITQNSFDPIQTLKEMIELPSFSGEEKEVANLLSKKLDNIGISHLRSKNNIWAFNKYFHPKKKTVLLNSHIDTVKPNSGYSKDPFSAEIENGKLFGLGSNDAGGSVVALLQTFVNFYLNKDLKYNLILAITAEEENSGRNGIRSVLEQIPDIDFAIVGEPTDMQMAIGEKGLLVLDVESHGKSGHAAHFDNENAIDVAMQDIQWFHEYEFDKKSELLGPVKMTVTQVHAGTQHNVVPDQCSFVVDIRVNEHYSNQEIIELVANKTKSKVSPRSTHLNSSGISLEHPIVKAGITLGIDYYGSPTLSDQVHLSCSSLKIGPGKSERSHKADEFIYVDEIIEGVKVYEQLLNVILL